MSGTSLLSRLAVSVVIVSVSCSRPSDAPAEPPSSLGLVDPEAVVARTYDVVAPDGEPPIGILSAGPVCDGLIVAPDPRNGVIQVISLRNGQRLHAIGARGTPNGLRAPESVAVACETKDLYVLDTTEVMHYKLDSGEFVASRPRPDNIGIGTGGHGFVVGGEVVFPALFLSHKEALRENPESHMLRGASIGYAQRLTEGGAARPLVPLLTETCRNTTPCARVTLSRIQSPTAGWLACQGTGTVVGVFDDDGNSRARIDVASPAFVSNGSSVASSAPIPVKMQWLQRNSSVMWCAAVGNYIVVAHSTLEKGDWEPGMAIAPIALMNVYTMSGAALSLDVPIADIPVASDQRSIYVPVYGDARRLGAAQRIQIQQVDIVDTDGALTPIFRR